MVSILKRFWKEHRKQARHVLVILVIYELADQLEYWLRAVGLRRVNDWLAISEHAWVLCVLPEQQEVAERFCRKQRAVKPVDGRVELCPALASLPKQQCRPSEEGHIHVQRGGGERPGGNEFQICIPRSSCGMTNMLAILDSNQVASYWRLNSQEDLERLVTFHRSQVFKLIRHETDPKVVHQHLAFPGELSRTNIPIRQILLLDTESFDLASQHWQHILEKANQTPFDQRVVRKKRTIYALCSLCIVLFALIISGYWIQRFFDARQSVQQVKASIQHPVYESTDQNGVFYPSVTHWQNIRWLYSAQLSLKQRGGLWLGSALSQAIHYRYETLLRRQFLPVITAQLAEALRLSLKIHSPWVKFQRLRAYLMLGDQKHRRFSSVKAVFYSLHQDKNWQEAEDWKRFSQNLSVLFSLKDWQVHLDATLVQAARGQLRESSVAQLLYALSVQESPGEWRLQNQLDTSTAGHFIIPTQSLPRYLTAGGENAFWKMLNKGLPNKFAEMEWVLGGSVIPRLDRGIQAQLKTLYQENALSAWSEYLSHIRVSSAENLSDWILVLSSFKDPKGALPQVSKMLLSNIPKTIHSEWQGWISWMKHSKANLKTWDQVISNIQKQLMQIQSSDMPGKEAVSQLRKLKSGNKNAFVSAQMLSNHLPAPLNKWLQSIVKVSQQVVLSTAQKAANQSWNRNVSPLWSVLKKQFPFDQKAKREASMADVVRLFKPGGVLDQWKRKWHPTLLYIKSSSSRAGKASSSRGLTAGSRQLKSLNSWQSFFYRQHAKLSFTWQFTPISMSPNIASFAIQSRKQEILYQHGPTNPQSIHWPTHSPVIIRVINLHGHVWQKRYMGHWAMFRVIALFRHAKSEQRFKTIFGGVVAKLNIA